MCTILIVLLVQLNVQYLLYQDNKPVGYIAHNKKELYIKIFGQNHESFKIERINRVRGLIAIKIYNDKAEGFVLISGTDIIVDLQVYKSDHIYLKFYRSS